LYAAGLYLWIAYFRPEAWAWSDVFASLNLSYFAGVFLVIRAVASGSSMQVTKRNVLLLLFLGMTLLSVFASVDVPTSWVAWQAFAKTIIVSYLLTTLIKTESDLRLILYVIAGSLGFEAAKQGWAQLVLNPGARNDNTIPFLGDNNVVALGMAMLTPLLSALAATSTGWYKRGAQFVNVGIIYRGLSTYSRGGFLSFGAVAGMTFLRSSHKARALVAGALVAALILPVLPTAFWDRMSTIAAPAEERDDAQAGRLHFWRVAIAMVNDRPLLGVGHAAYPSAYDRYDWTDGRYSRRRSVHSSWFGILADTGYPAFALFLFILFSSLWTCRRVRRMAKRGEIPESLGHYAIGLESALVAFMVGGTFVPFHYVEMLWHFLALTMALDNVAAAQAASIREQRTRETKPAVDKDPVEEFVWA
jgi:probable O-glycosylation ligase (exosortase A-associated)